MQDSGCWISIDDGASKDVSMQNVGETLSEQDENGSFEIDYGIEAYHDNMMMTMPLLP